VPGELLMGGAGVGRYYVAQPELTAARFIPDPLSSDPQDRVYRTGDLCRYRADGRIEFLGRIDHQIKIRGFRVELGEIEAVLAEHSGIRECVVVDRFEEFGERRLIGYIVPANPLTTPDSASVREFLKRKLPDYMVPATFVVLERLPLTRTGKIDRSALPVPTAPIRIAPNGSEGPRNQVERELVRIWERLLHMTGVGLTDDFFQIGGHSLMAVRLMWEVNSAFGIQLPLATIFRAPTVQSLAAAVTAGHELHLKPPGLISPRAEDVGQRIFWAPSIGAVERYVECNNLARLLRGKYRFFGFDPAPECKSVADLAKHSVALIRQEQPRGPYFLAGYCQCGHVAYEIATQLAAQGEEIDLLGIIDCSARDFAAGLHQRIRWVRDGFRGRPEVVARRIRSVLHRKLLGENGAIAISEPNATPFVLHGQVVSRHRAARFPGTIELFRSEEWQSRLPHSPKLGWDALARDVQVHQLECKHLDMVSVPAAVEFIARRFSEYLN